MADLKWHNLRKYGEALMSQVADVYKKVAPIIADVLVIDEEEVALNKRLISDLGAESIDFLDLVFQLEQEFKIKIPRGQIEKEVRGSLSEHEFEQNGVLTEQGIAALKRFLPEVPPTSFKDNFKVTEISTLFTVETLCNMVIRAQEKTRVAEVV